MLNFRIHKHTYCHSITNKSFLFTFSLKSGYLCCPMGGNKMDDGVGCPTISIKTYTIHENEWYMFWRKSIQMRARNRSDTAEKSSVSISNMKFINLRFPRRFLAQQKLLTTSILHLGKYTPLTYIHFKDAKTHRYDTAESWSSEVFSRRCHVFFRARDEPRFFAHRS